jgi:Uma2 family endonuclease
MSAMPPGTSVYLCPEVAGTLMTPEEFDTVEDYDEEYNYELIHGVLIVTPLPLAGETDPNEELGHLLRAYQEHHRRGRTLDKTLPQQHVRTRTSRRLADRVIWTGLGRLPDLQRDLPAIVIEFVSRRRRDRQRDYEEKRREYMKVGIHEYWIIDRFQRTMTVIVNRPEGEQERVIRANQVYRTPLLPGFQLPLARILALAGAWDPR